MSRKPRILAFAGSARAGSYNKKLVRVAARGAEKAGGECSVIDLRDFPMPIYDADLEAAEGMPPQAKRFRDLLLSHQALLISSPENNSSVSALLKNGIDWATRNEQGEGDVAAFKGKAAALLSASPGALGGLRGLVHLRAILGNIGCLVIPEQFALSRAHEAFDDAGEPIDPKQAARAEGIGAALARITAKIGAD